MLVETVMTEFILNDSRDLKRRSSGNDALVSGRQLRPEAPIKEIFFRIVCSSYIYLYACSRVR